MVHVFSIMSDSLKPYALCLPGSSVHGILHAGILEWVTIFFSRGSSRPRDQTGVSYNTLLGRWILLPLNHMGSPLVPWPGIKLMPLKLEVQSFNHRSTREVPWLQRATYARKKDVWKKLGIPSAESPQPIQGSTIKKSKCLLL